MSRVSELLIHKEKHQFASSREQPLCFSKAINFKLKYFRIWNLEYERAQAKGMKPNLIKCIFKAFWYDFFKLALLSIINDLGLR